jgi:hypothetical protein
MTMVPLGEGEFEPRPTSLKPGRTYSRLGVVCRPVVQEAQPTLVGQLGEHEMVLPPAVDLQVVFGSSL